MVDRVTKIKCLLIFQSKLNPNYNPTKLSEKITFERMPVCNIYCLIFFHIRKKNALNHNFKFYKLKLFKIMSV